MEILVDGSNLVHKLFRALPHVDEVPGAILRQLRALKSTYVPDKLRFALDAEGDSWRRDLVPEYKAQRPEKAAELRELLDQAETCCLEVCDDVQKTPGHEADDILATWAARCETRSVVVSSDKDLYQCLKPGAVTILRSFRVNCGSVEKPQFLAYADFVNRYKIDPPQWPLFRALVGDRSDNLAGVPGVGEEGAKKVLRQWYTLDDFIDAMKSGKESPLADKLTKKIVDLYDCGDLGRWSRISRLSRNVPLAEASRT